DRELPLEHVSLVRSVCFRSVRLQADVPYLSNQPQRLPSGAFSLATSIYRCPSRSPLTCAAVRSTEPEIEPFVALVISRVPIASPRTPRARPAFSLAVVAGDLRPSKVPVTDSFAPVSVAVAEPNPATVFRIPPSIGTVASRTLKRSGFCDEPGEAIASNPAHAAIKMYELRMRAHSTIAYGVLHSSADHRSGDPCHRRHADPEVDSQGTDPDRRAFPQLHRDLAVPAHRDRRRRRHVRRLAEGRCARIRARARRQTAGHSGSEREQAPGQPDEHPGEPAHRPALPRARPRGNAARQRAR